MIFTELVTTDEPEPKSDCPCLGHEVANDSGDEYECGYGRDFTCEECVCNGGSKDPRDEPEEQDDLVVCETKIHGGITVLFWGEFFNPDQGDRLRRIH